MALSQRERNIGIGTAAVLGFAALWYLAISPYLEGRAALRKQVEQVRGTIDQGNDTLDRRNRLNKVWMAMQAGGMKMDSSDAETQVLRSLTSWAQSSKLSVSISRDSDRTEGKFQLVNCRANATGGQEALTDMLWYIESATIPLRVNSVDITPLNGDENKLSIKFDVSTLCQPPETDKPKSASGARE